MVISELNLDSGIINDKGAASCRSLIDLLQSPQFLCSYDILSALSLPSRIINLCNSSTIRFYRVKRETLYVSMGDTYQIFFMACLSGQLSPFSS